MKGLVLFVCCLVVAGTLAHEETITANVCDDCTCPPAKKLTLFNMKPVDGKDCYCSCGAPKFGECVEDADCAYGLHCAAGSKKDGNGQCEDACRKPGLKCGMFDRCQINSTGDPECICRRFDCIKNVVGRGVCAFNEDLKEKEYYENDCLFVNAHCDLRKSTQPELTADERLKKLPLSDCADLIGVGKRSGLNSGFQFNSRF